jgi:hypothetical protein
MILELIAKHFLINKVIEMDIELEEKVKKFEGSFEINEVVVM